MADHYNFQQLTQTLRISEARIKELQEKGLLQPFLSSQQAYRLRAAVRWAHKNKIDLVEAFAKVEERWVAHANTPKD